MDGTSIIPFIPQIVLHCVVDIFYNACFEVYFSGRHHVTFEEAAALIDISCALRVAHILFIPYA